MSDLKLGITKVGDLLLQNKISNLGNGISLENIRLKIPEYQRPYKWTAKNVNQLLDDILQAKSENKEVYRVGTLILHHDIENANDSIYNIVDGQQRTITFSLLLKVLGYENINFLNQRLSKNPYNLHNVRSNYKTLERRINNFRKTEDANELKEFSKELKDLRKYVENNCELIVVITTDISEAFQFFDSQNARGKSLYPHDLLKAYHLREMSNVSANETESIVKTWEDLPQNKLATLFNEYLYYLKEWIKGNRASELTEKNIELFKGITAKNNYAYAQFYKGAFAYADELNNSHIPFVTGIQKIAQFQLTAPIIAGKPFFEYAKHYFDILSDIQNNDKYEGFFINDNEIVKTLDLYKSRKGDRITRFMFDTAILLYVDRFCAAHPSKTDIENLEQFVVFAFIWAYSMRIQYKNISWLVAQNFIMGTSPNDVKNNFNIYKTIANSDSPSALFSVLSDKLLPISSNFADNLKKNSTIEDKEKDRDIYSNYHYFFKKYNFLEITDEQK